MTIVNLAAGSGATYSFLGSRATVKVGDKETTNALTIIESECPPGWATPLHLHEQDDEAFYVLSGGMRVYHGEDVSRAEAGAFVLLDKGRPHAFAVDGDEPLRVLQLTWPAGFEHFVAEVAALPPGAPDPARLAEIAAEHGIQILGPPPA